MHIYPLKKGQPVVVTMPTNPARIVVTDGFHITAPVQIAYTPNVRITLPWLAWLKTMPWWAALF